MKIRSSIAAAAVATVGTYAQINPTTYKESSPAPTTSSSVSYTTVTYEDCPSSSMETMITVTEGTTVTYCPECIMTSQISSHPGYTTIYTTTYESLCPTGIVPATYTVTESCTEATPTWTPGPSHIPNGFTVTTKQCTVCDTTPTAVTITEPCGCEATEGVPASNTAVSTTPAAPTGSSPAATTPASSPSPSPACNGADCGGSANTSPAPAPYPTASTTTEICPGPQCRAAASPYPSGVTYGNTSGIEPSPGAASSLSSIGLLSSFILAVTVAAFAFML